LLRSEYTVASQGLQVNSSVVTAKPAPQTGSGLVSCRHAALYWLLVGAKPIAHVLSSAGDSQAAAPNAKVLLMQNGLVEDELRPLLPGFTVTRRPLLHLRPSQRTGCH
jgi:2-dehydropantoate 2-reductase